MTEQRPKVTMRSGSKETTSESLETVRVKLLGGFSVSVGSRIVVRGQWRLRKAAVLVKLLALAPGHRLHREQAVDLLWPDSSRKAAPNNLRQALHAARRALDPVEGSRYLVSEDASLSSSRTAPGPRSTPTGSTSGSTAGSPRGRRQAAVP